MLDGPGFNSRQGKKFFFSPKTSRSPMEAKQLLIRLAAGALSQGVKRPERVADL